MDYKFLIVATDWSEGQPGGGGDDDGGKGSQAGGGEGPWSEGFETLQGDWEPEGFRVMEFSTEDAARRWYASTEGHAMAEKYDSIILVRVHA